jgi:hypothetical protein
MKAFSSLPWFRAISTCSLLACATLFTSGLAQADPHPAETEVAHKDHGSLAEIGNKLANPVSDVWALFTQFGITSSDGDVNTGNPEAGGNIIFQPILPFPLYGEGK